MGAEQFVTKSAEADVVEAFADAVAEAEHEHGHGGYSGTIAEKDSYVVWETDLPGSVAVQQLRQVWNPTKIPPHIPENIYRAYDDKWGPAVAVRDEETGGWIFCGWASS